VEVSFIKHLVIVFHASCMQLSLLWALQRTLDIRFVPAVLEDIKNMTIQGASFEGEKTYVNSKE